MTCEYLPDNTFAWWDEGDHEHETELAELGNDGCSCSECGYTMMDDPDIGWFDHWPDLPGVYSYEPYVPIPRFSYCPNCGSKVDRAQGCLKAQWEDLPERFKGDER